MEYDNLEQQIDELWAKDEEELYAALGVAEQATRAYRGTGAEATMRGLDYDAFLGEGATRAATDLFRDLGHRWWAKLEPLIYDLLCNEENEDREKFMGALLVGARQLALALVPTLIDQLNALPSAAIVLATIAAKKIADSGLTAMCGKWAESIEQREEAADAEAGL
ncbi:MAG: hypothetical protein PVG11_04455 [Anaerolineae bacterium]|jgi:hypothetical protein